MDWNKLKTYHDWSGKLAELLDEAHDAIAAGDVNKKLESQRALNEFIDIDLMFKNCKTTKFLIQKHFLGDLKEK